MNEIDCMRRIRALEDDNMRMLAKLCDCKERNSELLQRALEAERREAVALRELHDMRRILEAYKYDKNRTSKELQRLREIMDGVDCGLLEDQAE